MLGVMPTVWRHLQLGRWLTLAIAAVSLFVSGMTAQTILVWSMGGTQSTTQVVADYLTATERFASVTAIDSTTLTLPDIVNYDAILFFSNSNGDPALGDVLADYADTGHRLVLATFVWAQQSGNTLAGRIITDGMSPVVATSSSAYTYVTIGSTDGSAFFSGVATLSGYFHDTVQPAPGAGVYGWWSDGTVLVASKGNIVAVNLFPDDTYAHLSGDYAVLFANALLTPVPEPSTALLIATGAGAFAVWRWRCRRRSPG